MGGRWGEGGRERVDGEHREREREFFPLFYKDCSLGSVKACLTISPCYRSY